MATSGTYSFSVTRDQLIRQAMLNLQKLDGDEDPTSAEASDLAFMLNLVVKQCQGKSDFGSGLKVWTRRRGHLYLSMVQFQYLLGPAGVGWAPDASYATTTAAQAAAQGASSIIVTSATGIALGYVIGVILATGEYQWMTVASVAGTTINLNAPLTAAVGGGAIVVAYQLVATQPLDIETVSLRDQFNNDTPVRLLRTVQDYDLLPAKTQPQNISDPGAIYYEFQLTNSNLFLDVAGASDVTKHLVITYMEAIQDITNPNDNPEFPQEYFNYLAWELANQASAMFGVIWTEDLQKKYDKATAIAKNKSAEVTTIFFQPGED